MGSKWVLVNLAPQLVGSRCDYQIAETDGILMLTPTASSWHCAAPVPDSGLLPAVLELCAGFGGMGIGTSFLGGEVAVSVDHNGLSISHLQRNTKGPVLQLDLTCLGSAKLIHQQCSSIGTTTLGFPCQPFSSQGSQMRADTRFAVFQPSAWNVPPLESWTPTSTFQTVGHIVETWGVWPLEDEKALSLTAEAHQFYADPSLAVTNIT